MSTAVINGTIFTLGEPGQVIENGAVLYDEGTIVEVGPSADIQAKADETIDAGGRVVARALSILPNHRRRACAITRSAYPGD